MQEIWLPGIEAEALRQVVDFVYTGSLELSPANIQSVLACASQLQVQSVQQPVPVTVLLPAADSGDANLAIAALVSTVIALICVAYY